MPLKTDYQKTDHHNRDLYPLRALKKENLGNQVFEQFKGMILSGEFPPGKRVVESEIATSMGISRTPVREALHKLKAERLLKPLPKGGYAVRGLSLSDIEETFDIRIVLESFAGCLAAKRHEKQDLDPLEEKLMEFERNLAENNLKELTRINTEFHEILYDLSKSPRLIKMINDLRDEIFLLRNILLKSKDMARLSNKDHKAMIMAIKKREASEVERLIREHLIRGKEFVVNKIKKGDLNITLN